MTTLARVDGFLLCAKNYENETDYFMSVRQGVLVAIAWSIHTRFVMHLMQISYGPAFTVCFIGLC